MFLTLKRRWGLHDYGPSEDSEMRTHGQDLWLNKVYVQVCNRCGRKRYW